MTAKTKTHICSKEAEIAVMKNTLDNTNRLVEEIHHRLIGNGQPGVLADIKDLKNMKNEFDDTKRRVADIERKMWKFTGIVAVVTFLLSIVLPRVVNAWFT